MNLTPFLKTAQKFTIQNSPTILTVVGVVGVVSTSLLMGRAAFRVGMDASTQYHEEIHYGQKPVDEAKELLSPKYLTETYWREFIPPAVIGAITLAAIIGSNRIGTRRATALAAAFAMSERMAEEYRQKVVEHMGAKKEEMVRSDVARERIQKVDGTETIVLSDAEILFYDSWSDRVFRCSRERVESAANQINHQINHQWAASLTEFYDLIGLGKTAVSDDFGWNSDELLDLYYTSTLLPDGKPACEIRYNVQPFQNFNRIGI